VEVVSSLSQGRTAAAQCGLFTHKSVPVIFEPSCRFPDAANDKYVVVGAIISKRDDDKLSNNHNTQYL